MVSYSAKEGCKTPETGERCSGIRNSILKTEGLSGFQNGFEGKRKIDWLTAEKELPEVAKDIGKCGEDVSWMLV